MGTGLFPGLKQPGRGTNQPPHLNPRLKKERNYTSSPFCTFMAGHRVNFTYYILLKLPTCVICWYFIYAFVHGHNALQNLQRFTRILNRVIRNVLPQKKIRFSQIGR